MKPLTMLLLLAIAVAGGAYVYRNYLSPPLPEYPVARMLTSSDGKALDASILGKTGNVLHIERVNDGNRFDLPIERLAEEDRKFALRLPEETPPAPPKAGETDPYIKSREALIADLQRKIAEAKSVVKSGDSMSGMVLRKRREEIVKMEKEVKTLQSEISIQRGRTKAD